MVMAKPCISKTITKQLSALVSVCSGAMCLKIGDVPANFFTQFPETVVLELNAQYKAM